MEIGSLEGKLQDTGRLNTRTTRQGKTDDPEGERDRRRKESQREKREFREKLKKMGR